jgi:hypothetical protein
MERVLPEFFQPALSLEAQNGLLFYPIGFRLLKSINTFYTTI